MCEAAWAAGLFDGEGCTSVRKANDRSKKLRWKYPQVSVAQKDPNQFILKRLQALLGGRIYRTGKVDIYMWQLTSKDEAEPVLNILWPYLSEPKKVQALRVLAECDAWESPDNVEWKKVLRSLPRDSQGRYIKGARK